ncbi:PREDICTED: uncharacterized protein LOC106809762 [Priapulus caudatus]|uniref:Uncharacterized protein LOC106809762 n=1 Tax=Priapulus caudatus TaxID=37621 RepID=A0ABM1E8C7_PRICU|nr:PREDICTED: uncharacterized protein LOC106809762 [Priapulus caudatus]
METTTTTTTMTTVAATFAYYACVLVGLRACRGIARCTLAASRLRLALEIIATLQTCLFTFENGVVAATLGRRAYIAALFLGSLANQLELCVARAAFPVAQAMRAALPCAAHNARARAWSCVADLRVSAVRGAWYEFLATLLHGLFCVVVKDRWRRVGYPLAAVASTVTTLAGLQLTGMYYNPILATAAQFGCEGATRWDHFIVYWIGPILASLLLSFYARLRIKRNVPRCAAVQQPAGEPEIRDKRG